jgi:L-ornithine N5-oxygenase
MYDQKVEDGIPRRKGDVLPVPGARITIMPSCDLVSAGIRTETGAKTEAFTLVFQNTITKDVSETTYDAVVCATGYERHSWMNILKSTSIGSRFGLSPASDLINLAAEGDLGTAVNGKNGHSRALTSALKKQGMRTGRTDLESDESGMPPTSRVTGNSSHQI